MFNAEVEGEAEGEAEGEDATENEPGVPCEQWLATAPGSSSLGQQ